MNARGIARQIMLTTSLQFRTNNIIRTNNKGRLIETSLGLALGSLSGECRLTLLHATECLIAGLRRKSVIVGLKSDEFCLQIADALLQTAHLRDHSRVRTADVAE